jgi:pilus assembly protein CpaB
MNRNTRTLVVVVIAVAVAGFASYWVVQAIQSRPVREVEVRSRYQVVAARDLEMGTMLTKEDVKLVPWPASSPVDKGFTTIESVVNRGLIDGVVSNEPLTELKLASLEAGGGLPPTIPEGMRAVSVRVNEVIGVAGFLLPGNRVDVMVTMKNDANKDSMTRVVLSDVQVLTAGTKYEKERAREGTPIQTTVVTLLVTPPDAEKIALAGSEGSIMLTLRNPMDRTPTQTVGVRTAALLGQPAPPPVSKPTPSGRRIVQAAAPPPAPPPPPKPPTVETFRGGKRSEEVIKSGGGSQSPEPVKSGGGGQHPEDIR